ncbi:MAG: hypothetical protein ACRC10_04215 [Thermoguttaceae bacterium]
MLVLREMFAIMREYYQNRSEQEWWSDDPLKVIVGAILVPGTSWPNVARVLDSLKRKNLLNFQQLLEIDVSLLEEIIRPVGFQQRKAPTIKETIRFLHARCLGNLTVYFQGDTDLIRSELLKLGGIGPKTADNILLYAGNQRVYSVDKHTIRIFLRHGIIGERTKEAAVKELIAESFAGTSEEVTDCYNEFQALITRISRDFCSKTKPDCRTCPLSAVLPEKGPLHCQFEAVSQNRLRKRPELPGKTVLLAPDHADSVQSRNLLPHLSPESFLSTSSQQQSAAQTVQPTIQQPVQQSAQYSVQNSVQNSVQQATPQSVQESMEQPIRQPVPVQVQQELDSQGLLRNHRSVEPVLEFNLTEMEQKIFALVSEFGTPIDRVIQQSGLPTGQVLATLSALEMRRLVRRKEGNNVARH